MINCVADQTGQRLILEILQLLSEYEYIVKLLGEIKGDESPIELFKGVAEQPEPVQIEFLRWVSQKRKRRSRGIRCFCHLVLIDCCYIQRTCTFDRCPRWNCTIVNRFYSK